MNDKLILGSLALDLKRAALGFYRGSYVMAERFLHEAITRKKEYKNINLQPYIVKILNQIEELKVQPKEEIAEQALMYSTLIQNYVLQA
ncbi:hypothetical protein A2Y99_05310 [Candidatus Gottesmanbacteria bacterium RBG_13_37_7]|uniref:HEPN domain-containing protein n=1 Tax=Candidatus Gottesmanbacteria bacterium RBG_13_37_7 TaxID=1798369 RepID=A0A1F5YKE3_9BACT|nr:MAG: hypothetical protein A2Y99_05310 [Candidatus Gottesmanbacteria bacterium RBG_13_37_7]HJX50761.1 hypothetical protein [Candidatus Nanoarchaeia archaeon]